MYSHPVFVGFVFDILKCFFGCAGSFCGPAVVAHALLVATMTPRAHAKAGLQACFISLAALLKHARDRLLIAHSFGHFHIVGLQSCQACCR